MFVNMLDRMSRDAMPFYVYKVLAYPKDENFQEYKDVTKSFFNCTLNVHEDKRLEYRFLWNDVKYRYLDTTGSFPSFCMMTKKQTFPIRILNADLNGEDVTRHVQKFEGPNGDFFGTKFPWRWMFPNEFFSDLDTLVITKTDLTRRELGYRDTI